jgi:tRNA uridine 5-carbamoylmethylation protein Kti12
MTVPTTVLLLMGLPGSGKSSLCQHWLGEFPDCIHVEYDAVVQDTTLESWRLSRHTALAELARHLHEGNSRMILMDDNFHLSSMRKQVYHVCQKYRQQQQQDRTVRIGILWLDTPLESCLGRNRQRLNPQRVPDDIIIKMNKTLEPPPRLHWEKNCCQRIVHDKGMHQTFVSCYDIVTVCVDISAPLARDVNDERRQTRKNRVHEWDQVMRQWVGCVARIHRSSVNQANETRKICLEQVRRFQGRWVTDDDKEVMALFINSVIASGDSWSNDEVVELHIQLNATFSAYCSVKSSVTISQLDDETHLYFLFSFLCHATTSS